MDAACDAWHQPDEIADAFEAAAAESKGAFGDGRLYLEKLIEGGRHIEVQVIATDLVTASISASGVQPPAAPSEGRRGGSQSRAIGDGAGSHPAPGLRCRGTSGVPERRYDRDAVGLGRKALVHGNEHQVASRAPCERDDDRVDLWSATSGGCERGASTVLAARAPWAFDEFRINAEDPDAGFKPSRGVVTELEFPEGEGIRVDTHLQAGDRIRPTTTRWSPSLIVHADSDRRVLRWRARPWPRPGSRGVRTNLELHRRIVQWAPFVSGEYDTTPRDLDGDLTDGQDPAAQHRGELDEVLGAETIVENAEHMDASRRRYARKVDTVHSGWGAKYVDRVHQKGKWTPGNASKPSSTPILRCSRSVPW